MNGNGQANTLVNGHKDPVDQPSAPSLSLKEPSPPPLPPKDSVSSSATVSVPSSHVQTTGSVSEHSNTLEAVMPAELPPELPPKKAVKTTASTTDKSNGEGNVYVWSTPPKKSLHNDRKEQQPSLPPWKAVVNLPCNNKNASLPVLLQKQVLVPSPPSSYNDNSDNVFNHNHKSARGRCMMTDKYISIRNDHSSGSINIFVSKPECIVESSDSSEEEGDNCNGEVEYDTLVLPQNNSLVSPEDKKEASVLSDSVKNLSTARKPPHGLPPLEFKHLTSPFPFDAPFSAPPVGVEAALPTSVVKFASSNGMSVSNGITSGYSQLELSPEKMKQQVLMH